MKCSRTDRQTLRDLATRIAEIAATPAEREKIRLWTACNDLRPERPMVYADPQNGWRELDEAWLTLTCDPALRFIEHPLRRSLIRHQRIPDDCPLTDTFAVPLVIRGDTYNDYGVSLLTTRPGQSDGAYHIEPVIGAERDADRLHFRPIVVDHAATDRAADLVQDILGDILTVRKESKRDWRYGLTRVLVHMRGLEQMLLDLYDHPALLHRLMAFLRDDFLNELDLLSDAQAISLNNSPARVNGSGGLGPTTALPAADSGLPPHVSRCVCWAEAQETVGVGPELFHEFVLQYQLPLMARFGLVDYGCCEPLDQKYDLLMRHIPNLRWLAVPPGAQRRLAAEKIGNRYVFVYKPNPSFLCTPTPNWEQLEHDIRETLAIARGCALQVVMKDTTTFCRQPERITQWAGLATRIVREMV